MFLTKAAIREEIKKGNIEITPLNERLLNPNSYNVRLDRRLLVYDVASSRPWHKVVKRVSPRLASFLKLPETELDILKDNPYRTITIPPEGYVLKPGTLYLGRTIERTYSAKHVPLYEGRSSTARLGLESHICGGWGDIGFDGTWTLEIRCTHPIRIYAGMEIGQVAFAESRGKIVPYGSAEFRSRYQGQVDPTPSKPFDVGNIKVGEK